MMLLQKKKLLMSQKDAKTTTHSLGFRITALNVQTKDGKLIKRRKDWGKGIKPETMQTSLAEFFTQAKTPSKVLIEAFLKKLREISKWFELQSKLRFYSSSLLFLFDAEDTQSDPNVDIRLIDFAHVSAISEEQGRDSEYQFGLQNLIRHLEALRDL